MEAVVCCFMVVLAFGFPFFWLIGKRAYKRYKDAKEKIEPLKQKYNVK